MATDRMPPPQVLPEPAPVPRHPLRALWVGLVTLVSFVYLLNFTFGVVELPDNLPIVGNMDEAAAALLFFSGMRYFGVDLTLFRRRR